jgi:hypothetical protein
MLIIGGGANKVITLSLRGGFIAEAISLTDEGIASVAIAPSQRQAPSPYWFQYGKKHRLLNRQVFLLTNSHAARKIRRLHEFLRFGRETKPPVQTFLFLADTRTLFLF